MWDLPIFGKSNVYLHNQSRKKPWVLQSFGDVITCVCNQLQKSHIFQKVYIKKYIYVMYLFSCWCPYKKRLKSRNEDKQVFIWILRVQEDAQQYAAAECCNIAVWSSGKWRNYGFWEDYQQEVFIWSSAGKIPLKRELL